MSGSKEEIVAKPLPKLVRALLGIWLLLGCLPIFAAMFGINFLPSTEWISTSSFPGLAAGLPSTAFLAWAVLKGPPKMKTANVLATLLFGYFLGKNAAVLAVPMIHAMIAGHHVELPFTVVGADQYGDRRCRSPIEFQGLPFFFDRVCGFANDFRQGLTPGSRIVVIGRGTSLGVFAESLRRVD